VQWVARTDEDQALLGWARQLHCVIRGAFLSAPERIRD